MRGKQNHVNVNNNISTIILISPICKAVHSNREQQRFWISAGE